MILCIADLLSADERQEILALLQRSRFVSGARTAGWHARTVKRNTQLVPKSGPGAAAAQHVAAALDRNELVRAAARPLRRRPILFNRHDPGMSYGPHIDDPIMGDAPKLRADISMTVFLSDPASYDGGELVIDTTAGEQAFKLPAGSAILYPATTLHHVAPVTRGTRLAAITWIQSLVRDAARREMLFDLDMARREIFELHGKTRAFDLVAKTHANLLRLWAEPS